MHLDPMAQPSGDEARHSVIQGRAVKPPGGVMQRPERYLRERDLAPFTDLAVKRRAPVRASELAAQVAGQVRPPAGVVGGALDARCGNRLRPVGGLVPEQRAAIAHGGGPVGERMMDPPDQRATVAPDPHEIDSPQRPPAVQALLEQACDAAAQPVVVDRLVVVVLDDVVGDAERWIWPPRGRSVGRRVEPAGELRGELDALGDPGSQRRQIQRSVRQLDHLAGVADNRRALDREDRAILGAKRLTIGRRHSERALGHDAA